MIKGNHPKIAIYPGSFDPITNGHVDVIERALNIFDGLIVAVAINPEKKSFFSTADRLKMIKLSLSHLPNVTVESFDGLLAEYARQKKVRSIVRGMRALSDFDYEFQMALTNRKLDPGLETVFLMTDAQYSYLSSSLVNQIARLGGDVSNLVPTPVQKFLKIKGRK